MFPRGDVFQLSKSGERAIGRVGRAPSHAATSNGPGVVDELNLSPNIRTAHPPRLPLPDHVHGLVALDRPPRRVECTKALLGPHASFDRSMILCRRAHMWLNLAASKSTGADRERAVTARDDVAHMWLNLAASKSTGADRERAVTARDDVAARMTPADLSEAQRLAREWTSPWTPPTTAPPVAAPRRPSR